MSLFYHSSAVERGRLLVLTVGTRRRWAATQPEPRDTATFKMPPATQQHR